MPTPASDLTRRLSFVWFVWGPDAACLMQSVRAVRTVAPEAALRIRFDPDHPLPGEAIGELLEMGVGDIRASHAPHGGNLNGAAHFTQQMMEMEEAAAHGGDEAVVVKMDADVIVRRLDWLHPMLETGSPINAAGFRQGDAAPWCGPCYALRRGVPRLCRDALAEVTQRGLERLLLPPGLPEDGTLFALMRRAHLRGVLILPTWPDPRHFTGYQYDGQPLPRSSVAYFGNRHLLTGSDPTRRATVAQAMESAADELAALPPG